MAGIGFELRKLTRSDSLTDVFRGYTHSALISTGPWLFTVLSLGGITLFGSKILAHDGLSELRLIIIYNFAFSLVFSGPVIMVATRYLSDLIYTKSENEAPGMMLTALAILYISQLPVVLPFYLFYLDLDLAVSLAAICNYFLVTGIWLVSIFLGTLKAYTVITRTIGIGMFLAVFFGLLLSLKFSVVGMLFGFNLGQMLIMFSLIAKVIAEYPHRVEKPFGILSYFEKYWEIALGGLIYNLGIWVDKWIMWFAPERVKLENGMVSYPNYDSAMFLAYLTIVPAMALFFVSIETDFFETYIRFYRSIIRHETYGDIDARLKNIIKCIAENSRLVLMVQGSISIAVIAISPLVFQWLGVNYLQLGIFRLGVLGAFFHVMMLFLTIVISYFDMRKEVLIIQFLFFISNALFTFTSLKFGFSYYGYGYFLASIITFITAYLLMTRLVSELPFITFVKKNISAKRG